MSYLSADLKIYCDIEPYLAKHANFNCSCTDIGISCLIIWFATILCSLRTCMLIVDKQSASWVSLSDNIQCVIGVEIPRRFRNTYRVTTTALWVKSWMIHVNSQMYKTRDGGRLNNHTSLWQSKLYMYMGIASNCHTLSLRA